MQPRGYTFVHFFVAVFGNLLPLIVTLLFFWVFGPDSTGARVFYGDGQFYIYASTFYTTAGFIFLGYYIRINDRFFIGALIIGIALFTISTLYAWKIAVKAFDDSVLLWTSVVPFLISLPIYYAALRISHVQPNPDKFKLERLKLEIKKDRERFQKMNKALNPENKQKEVDSIANELPDE